MRIDTTVRDVMHREFLGVSESDTLADAAALLVEEGTDCLVVLRGGEAVGRLAARDALAAVLEGDVDDATVGSVMRPPLPTVAPDDGLRAVEERLVAEGIDRVVVAADGEAVGVVTARDSLAAGAARDEDPPEEPTGAADVRNGARLETTRSGTADAARGSERARTASSTDAAGAPTQGVCEVCGALAPDLADANGQAICPNCREV